MSASKLEIQDILKILIGRSMGIEIVKHLITKFGMADVPVLITGESGVGKEIVAVALHRMSPRSQEPFIPLNCGTLTETLMDSALFGHTRGSFTGATADRVGVFAAAKGGTIFLDEIGEMSLSAQVKLLRVLQDKKVVRIGESLPTDTFCRVIAATNLNLEDAVRKGRFRKDLWYRLNVAIIHVPPLRERAEDIPLLIRHFLKKHSQRQNGNGESGTGITDEAAAALKCYHFPGNIRELESAIISALALAGDEKIEVEHLPAAIVKGFRWESTSLSGRVHDVDLLATLKVVPAPGSHRLWWETLKSATVEEIHHFLVEHGARWFSRREFEEYLSGCTNERKKRYPASGRYIKALEAHGILERNGEQTSKRRFLLSSRFRTGEVDATPGMPAG